MRPSIGIAITTYNRREQLLRLVHSLRQHCRDQVHLAVFDDGSVAMALPLLLHL